MINKLRKITNMEKTKFTPTTPIKPQLPTQSQRFVNGRSAAIQYFVDVLALSFVLSVVLVLIMRHYK